MSKARSEAAAQPAPQYEEGKITVVVRCRPFNEREHSMRSLPCVEFAADGQTLQIFERGIPSAANAEGDKGRHHTFTFDKSYHQQVSQETVYIDVGRPVLDASLRGFNTCIFAYGQTGSGKSFAMMGPGGGRDATKAPGIIPRLCTELFEEVKRREDANHEAIQEAENGGTEPHMLPPRLTISVDVSYLEIYQEKVKCLLDAKKDNLKVRQHPALGVYVDQLTEVTVHSVDKVMDLIDAGNNSRHVASTNMNDRSSRSHAIFALTVTQKRQSKTKDGEDSVTELKSRINLVDLAGSERAKSTGAEGDTLREGAQINRSLTVLGLVISGLAEQSKPTTGKAPFIPYRDSTLTYLLKESLGGNSKTFMLSTVSPAHVNYEETLSTLRYADRAKSIVTKACINESAGDKKIRELEDEVSILREKIKEFQAKMEKQNEVARVVPKLNLSVVSSAQPSRGRAALSTSNFRGGGGRGIVATPRSAIHRVIVRDDDGANADELDDADDDDALLVPSETPRQPSDVLKLEQRLHLAESLMQKLSESEEKKEHDADELIQEIRHHKTVKATRADPYLLNLDTDLVSEFLVEYLVDEVTYIGVSELDEPVLNSRCIVVGGVNTEGIGPQHCCFIRSADGRVTLRPQLGYDTFIGASDVPVQDDVVLASGTTLSIGDNLLQFKFVDPAAAVPATARGRRSTMVSSSRPRLSPSVQPSDAVSSTNARHQDDGATQSGPDEFSQTPPLTPPAPNAARSSPPRAPLVGVPKLNLGFKLGGSAPAASRPSGSEVRTAATSVASEDLDAEGGMEPSPSPEKPAIPALRLPTRHADPTPDDAAADGSQRVSSARNRTANIATVRPQSVATARAARASLSKAPPAATASPSVVAFNEEVQAVFRHTYVMLGRASTGKSAFRAGLALKEKWYSFLKRETVTVQRTFGVEVSKIECGALQKIELSFVELSGVDGFSCLMNLLPDRRVSYILCVKLSADDEPPSLASVRNYLEFILCQTMSSDTTVMILVTHRDAVPTGAAEDRRLVQLLQDLEVEVRSFFELLQPLAERRPRVFAKFVVDNVKRTVLSPNSKMNKFSELLAFLGDHAVHRGRTDPDFPNCLVPTRLLNLSRKLLELRAQSRWCMSSTDYKSLAKQVDQRYERSLEELHRHTQLLHSWGVVHHHHRHMLLKKTVVLDITWVMELIAVLGCCLPGCQTPHGSVSLARLTRPALLQSADFDDYRASAPFSIKDLMKVDPHALCARGVLTIAAATELLRNPLKQKGYNVRNLDGILELLENYDLIMKGSKLKMSFTHHDSTPNRSRNSSMPQASSTGNMSFASQDDGHGDSDPDTQSFYLIPACFVGKTPVAVTIQMPRLLLGPFYRFSLNLIPPHFFSRFLARVSRYAQRLYLGPVSRIPLSTPLAAAEDTDAAPGGMEGGNFWSDSVWIVSSPTSRALVRLVHHSLFMTFHDAAQDEDFHEGLRHVVHCLVSESPGMHCEEAILCRVSLDCSEDDCVWRATDDDINSLEKIRERESCALKSARGSQGRGGMAELLRRNTGQLPEGHGGTNSPVEEELLPEDEPVPFVRPLDYVLNEVEVIGNISSECLLTDESLHRVERAVRLIHRGQSMTDRERGRVLEGRGMDQLVDALAQS